ncbi:hypothetical protein QQZ08_003773 [Neonectria magnoliae]|uniref:PD-(D/E)XK nuclease-like domain-containing protein n=1 Tax=Neonectria magnoliae TaxID=2732573 RepID=A0ABR1I853_9HYPO
MAASTHSPSPTLVRFLGDINDVAGRHCIMPRRIKVALEEHLDATGQFDRVRGYMFFDDDMTTGREQTRRDCTSGEDDEAAWNNLVHSPLLDMFVCDMRDGPIPHILDFLSCTTININSAHHRFPDAASRVDYVLQLLPERDPTSNRSRDTPALDMAPCFNWTADRLLQQYPPAISIETKRYGGNAARGEQQLGIWHAAHWEFPLSRAGAEAVDELPFLPGIVVRGPIWSLIVSTRR